MWIALLVVAGIAGPFLKQLDEDGKLIAFDQDEDARKNLPAR